MAFTPSQRAAIAFERNLILFAGPGSGKTTTSIAKARRILSDPGRRLCMVSFTNAAATELQTRLESDFARNGETMPRDRLIAGTFHSIALRHYQRHSQTHARLLGPPARSAMLQSMLVRYPTAERSEFILALDKYQGALRPLDVSLSAEQQEFIDEYVKKMAAAHATDLASVMRQCALKMASGEIPLLPITHLIGDEQQDADEVQLEFVLAHARKGVITTLVADDDQTIYEWRLALGFAGLQHFAAAADAKTIVLAENFRSRSEIVAHATALIAFNDPDRIEKSQKAVRGPGGQLACLSFGGLSEECEAVAQAIADYRAGDEEVAVLARANRTLDAMEKALASAEIPYQREGQTIWETAEVGVLLSLMRALVSSRTADLLPVLMLLQIEGKVRRKLELALAGECGDFFDGDIPEIDSATATDVGVLRDFSKCTRSWRKLLRSGSFDLAIPDIGLGLKGLLRGNDPDAGAAKSKRAGTLIDTAVSVLSRLKGSLSQRLASVARLQSREATSHPVRLMTMHSSKGLEFDTVYLIDSTHPDDGTTLMEDHPERRLFYVAMTRAKDQFFATYTGEPVKYIFEAQLPPAGSFAQLLEVAGEEE